MQQVDLDPKIKKSLRYRVAKAIWTAGWASILIFIVWPSSFYYLVMHTAPAGTNHPYRAAKGIGENGSIFFIRCDVSSSNAEIRSLMISPAIGSYLQAHGGTNSIWEIITKLLGDPEQSRLLEGLDRHVLEEYVYGPYVPVPGEKRSVRQPYFPVEKIQWANEHIFKKPRNYRIPEELLMKTSDKQQTVP